MIRGTGLREALARLGWVGVLVGLLLGAACGDGGIEYQGTAGQPIPAWFDGWVPAIEAGVDDDGPFRFLVDTGAPLTFLDTDSFAVEDGKLDIDLDAFGLRFPAYPAAAYDVFVFSQDDFSRFDGIVGGDVFSEFTLSLDYQNQRLWLDDAWDEALPDGVAADSVAASQMVSAPVSGGGLAVLPGDCPLGCGTRRVPATRVLIEVDIENLADPVWMLLDTGASAVVLDDQLVGQLDANGRPRLDGVTVGTAQGDVAAYFTRVWSLSLAGQVTEQSVAALVLADSALFEGLSSEVGVSVHGLIGGTFLRHYLCTLDYPNDRVALARYLDQGHIDPDEFVGMGFTMGRYDGAWRVEDVYPGTSAGNAGIHTGESVVEIDGSSIDGAEPEAVAALLAGFGLGDLVPVGVARTGGTEVLSIEVEDLLPAFEEP